MAGPFISLSTFLLLGSFGLAVLVLLLLAWFGARLKVRLKANVPFKKQSRYVAGTVGARASPVNKSERAEVYVATRSRR